MSAFPSAQFHSHVVFYLFMLQLAGDDLITSLDGEPDTEEAAAAAAAAAQLSTCGSLGEGLDSIEDGASEALVQGNGGGSSAGTAGGAIAAQTPQGKGAPSSTSGRTPGKRPPSLSTAAKPPLAGASSADTGADGAAAGTTAQPTPPTAAPATGPESEASS
jgi:hypothetical protein